MFSFGGYSYEIFPVQVHDKKRLTLSGRSNLAWLMGTKVSERSLTGSLHAQLHEHVPVAYEGCATRPAENTGLGLGDVKVSRLGD